MRITQTKKWKDSWFRSLNKDQKLLFIYLTENCDEAGFFDIDWMYMSSDLSMTIEEIKNTLHKINKCYSMPKVKEGEKVTKIWLNNFLLHQEKLPLNLQDDYCRKAYSILRNNLERFNSNKKMTAIISDATSYNSKNKKIKTKGFVEPTLEEFGKYYTELNPNIQDFQITQLYDYYISCDWKIGNKKIVDWMASVRLINSRNINNGVTLFHQQPKAQTKLSRLEKLNQLGNGNNKV